MFREVIGEVPLCGQGGNVADVLILKQCHCVRLLCFFSLTFVFNGFDGEVGEAVQIFCVFIPSSTPAAMNYEDLPVDSPDTVRLHNSRFEVPTDEASIKGLLRDLNEPVTLFGEDAGDRRARLIKLVNERGVDIPGELDIESGDDDEEMAEDFYTPASLELIEARKDIAAYALKKSTERLSSLAKQIQEPFDDVLVRRRHQNEHWKKFELMGSQLVASRPVSTVAINTFDKSILTGSWAGELTLLDDELEVIKRFSTEGKIGGLDWSPTDQSIFATAGDSVQIWRTDTEAPLVELAGHQNRVVRCRFHPNGQYVASASFDTTWRLWDVNTQQELLLQEGHSKEVYTVAWHPDGALLASAGLDALGHVWDVRSGKSIMVLEGHIKPIYGLSFRDNGVHVATGGADGSILIWDLRTRQKVDTISAHSKIVSDLKFHGNMLVSSSYDNTLKLYSSDNWISVDTLEGHSDKVMAVDLCDGYIVSTGWDRSVKKWCIV